MSSATVPRGLKRTRDGRLITVDPSALRPEQVDALKSFESILEDVQKVDPATMQKLACLKDIFLTLRGDLHENTPTPRCSIPASSFESVQAAAAAVDVAYNLYSSEHRWHLRDDDSSSGKLSGWADEAISRIQSSKYFQKSSSESLCRTIIDIIFCDRLDHLDDSDSLFSFNWLPEVPLLVESNALNRTITGRADWTLSYGQSQSDIYSTLIVLEAKRIGMADSALPQLIIYLAAIQDSRRSANKINYSVFGVLSDTSSFRFVFLDPTRKLFVSKMLEWACEKELVIKWIDKLLKDSIAASPHTTPIKEGNTTIRAYQTHLKHQYRFGTAVDDFELVEGESIDRYKIIGTYGPGIYEAVLEKENVTANDGALTHSHPEPTC